jgi:hypothetical protein
MPQLLGGSVDRIEVTVIRNASSQIDDVEVYNPTFNQDLTSFSFK